MMSKSKKRVKRTKDTFEMSHGKNVHSAILYDDSSVSTTSENDSYNYQVSDKDIIDPKLKNKLKSSTSKSNRPVLRRSASDGIVDTFLKPSPIIPTRRARSDGGKDFRIPTPIDCSFEVKHTISAWENRIERYSPKSIHSSTSSVSSSSTIRSKRSSRSTSSSTDVDAPLKRLSRRKARHKSQRYSIQDLRDFILKVDPTKNPLLAAARLGKDDTVRALIKKGMNMDKTVDSRGANALIIASEHDKVDVIVALYGLGVNLEAKDMFGNTALCCAAHEGHLKACTALLRAGANVNAKNRDGESVLMLVSRTLNNIPKHKYAKRMELCRLIVQKAKPKSLPKRKDVGSERVRHLLEEWFMAKRTMKELYIPPQPVFDKGSKSLYKFFHQEHEKLNIWEFVKVGLVLLFILYDFYSKSLTFTNETIALYSLLYILAYFI